MMNLLRNLLGILLLPLTMAAGEKLVYHEIQTDAQGHIVPWFDTDPGKSFDHVIRLVWDFWRTMRADQNGLPYYLNHQVWRPDGADPRGLGGDQLQMAMSSWRLLYAYSGDERVKENMRLLADWYLSRGLSPPDCRWPNVPFPYNTLVYSGIYDGDMVLGKDYAQADKAGSFGRELLRLSEMMNQDHYPNAAGQRYIAAAIAIADTLADKVCPGDTDHSPLPFKVNVRTGELGRLKSNDRNGREQGASAYTTNWAPTLELWLELVRLRLGRTTEYQRAADVMLAWMKSYPIANQKWGPFFEDIPGWSDTQTNAVTWAQFILEHRELFPDWRTDVERIFDWVYRTLGNEGWKNYGVTVINEQTVYQTPGNSHTARQAATELLFASLTNDGARRANAIRQLSWATYMVDFDGKNRYPHDDIWLTDGYGDYVRHYLRAMAADPELAPAGANHLVSSTSVIQQIEYGGPSNWPVPPLSQDKPVKTILVAYVTFDSVGTEVLRLARKPSAVFLGEKSLGETAGGDSSSWRELAEGGLLTIKRVNGNRVFVCQ
jgi:hypothetical protein